MPGRLYDSQPMRHTVAAPLENSIFWSDGGRGGVMTDKPAPDGGPGVTFTVSRVK